jgi:FkbM family methyltransferase
MKVYPNQNWGKHCSIKDLSKMNTIRAKMSVIHYLKRPEYYFSLRSVINKLFKPKKGVITHTTPWGNKMEIDVNETIGNAIYSTRIYDLALSETLWRLIEPGNFVLDIGANIGYVSSLCSFKTGVNGKVWSFEPNPLIVKRLIKNIEYSNFKNIKLFPFALSDKNKEGFLEIPEIFSFNQGVAFVGSGENKSNAIKIDLKKLDDVVPLDTIIDVLKIDVEGHELSVFKGAENLINKKLIANIIYEDHDPYPSDIAKFLLEKGYIIYRIEKGWFNLILKDPLSEPSNSGWDPINYLATLDTGFVKEKMKGYMYRCL